MVVAVLITSCHVSEKPKIGPETAQRRTSYLPSHPSGKTRKEQPCRGLAFTARLL